jgi:hypothetical protein
MAVAGDLTQVSMEPNVAPVVEGSGPTRRGARVWLDMDQEALDDAYNQ